MHPDPHGPSLDRMVDWLIADGAPITRIEDYPEWLRRFEIGLRGAPEQLVARTVLPLLDAFRQPTGMAPLTAPATSRFASAVAAAGLAGPDGVPGLSAPLTAKYRSDLAALGMTGDRLPPTT